MNVTLGAVMAVDELSMDGFHALSPLPAEPGSRHRFYVHHNGLCVELGALAVGCRLAGGTPAYAIDWRWGTDAVTVDARRRLIAAIAYGAPDRAASPGRPAAAPLDCA
jgi:hypothetical protein